MNRCPSVSLKLPKPFLPWRISAWIEASPFRPLSLWASRSTFWVMMVSRVTSAMVSPDLLII